MALPANWPGMVSIQFNRRGLPEPACPDFRIILPYLANSSQAAVYLAFVESFRLNKFSNYCLFAICGSDPMARHYCSMLP